MHSNNGEMHTENWIVLLEGGEMIRKYVPEMRDDVDVCNYRLETKSLNEAQFAAFDAMTIGEPNGFSITDVPLPSCTSAYLYNGDRHAAIIIRDDDMEYIEDVIDLIDELVD